MSTPPKSVAPSVDELRLDSQAVGSRAAGLLVGFNLTALSYIGRRDLGVIGDRQLAPDLWDLIDDVATELAALRRLLSAPVRRTGLIGH